MRELVLFTLENTRYGIWRDQILSVQNVESLHRLPFARSSLTVLSVFGGRTQTLADLSLCLGHPATREARGASAWLLSEKEAIRGFLVTGESTPVQASEALIRVPDFLRPLPIEGFFVDNALPVPVIDVSRLYEKVRKAEPEKPAPPLLLSVQTLTQSRSAARFRVFTSSGSHFAAPGAEITGAAASGHPVVRMPLLPPNIAGLALSSGRILPIVDLAFRVSGKKSRDASTILEASLNGTALGFLVDEDEGEWAAEDVLVKDLPPVLRAPWMSSAVLRGAHIAPVVELGAVLTSTARGERGKLRQRLHSTDSRFPAKFGHQAVEVVEFTALGTVFAVPKEEVADILPCPPFQEIPMAAGLVAGLADFGGELVPVLDLARIGGEHPQRTADWRMMVLKNGDFRALLMCESARAARTLDSDVQRGVPVVLTFPVVYGCYTDGDAVRLVLNIEELTVNYHESDAALLLPALAIAAEERQVRARAVHDVPMPPRPLEAPSEHVVSPEESIQPPPEPVQELAPPSEPPPAAAEPALPAEMELGSLKPSPADTHPLEPGPAPPVPEIEQNLPSEPAAPQEPTPAAEPALSLAPAPAPEPAPTLESAPAPEPVPSLAPAPPPEPAPSLEPAPAPEPALAPPPAPSIGEDILEPASHIAASPPPSPSPAPPRSESPTPGPTKAPAADRPAFDQSKRPEQGQRRTGRRIIVAAAVVVVLAAFVIAGLHFGVFRPRTTVQAAPAPAASVTTPAPAAPAAVPAPAPSATTPESASGETQYVVEKGDTLWDIAARFTGDPHKYHGIAAINGIADPDLIEPGQVIKLPR